MADMGKHDRRSRAANAFHQMMFRHPIPVKTQRFGVPGRLCRFGEGCRKRPPFRNRNEIEDR